MKWKSNARLSQMVEVNEEELHKHGTIFAVADKHLEVRIHKYLGCGDFLFLSCPELNIKKMDLDTEDFDTAVMKAKKVLMARINTLVECVGEFCTDDSKTEFVR